MQTNDLVVVPLPKKHAAYYFHPLFSFHFKQSRESLIFDFLISVVHVLILKDFYCITFFIMTHYRTSR